MFSGRHTLTADQASWWLLSMFPITVMFLPMLIRALLPMMMRALLLLMISACSYKALLAMQNGHYFIDRDGRHFHDILNYLRVSIASDSFSNDVMH